MLKHLHSLLNQISVSLRKQKPFYSIKADSLVRWYGGGTEYQTEVEKHLLDTYQIATQPIIHEYDHTSTVVIKPT